MGKIFKVVPFLFLTSFFYAQFLGCQGMGPIHAKLETEGYWGDENKEKVIVLIHGLLGHSEQTWRNELTGAYWPDLIRQDSQFQDFSVYLIGYDSPEFTKASTVEEIATRELQKLKDIGVFHNHKEVYFVTHSMGGIIAKRMLAKLYHPDPRELEMLDKVKAVLFLSTPSQGSELAKLVATVSSSPQVRDLEVATHNSFLQSLENEWQKLFSYRSKGVSYPKSFCAYETKAVFGIVIVARVYASTMCDNSPYAMDLNHMEMAKPASDKVDPYTWVKARIFEVTNTNGKSRIGLLKDELKLTPVSMALRTEDENIQLAVKKTLEGKPGSKGGKSELQEILVGDTLITTLVFNVGEWHFVPRAIQRYLEALERHPKFKFVVFLVEDQYWGWMPANRFLTLFFSDPEGITRNLNDPSFLNEFGQKLYKGQVSATVNALQVREKLEKTGEPGIAVLDDFGELLCIASREGIDSKILSQLFAATSPN